MLVLALPARADDVVAYEAEGQAAAAGTDPRVAALDDAFARAVTAALADLVDGNNRVAHKQELDREIVGHARLWVKAFTVTHDEVVDDQRHLVVSVRIDRDKLRGRLAELGIPAAAAAPEGPPESPAARQAVVLERLTTPGGARADYGPGAEPQLPGVAAATAALRGAGFAVRVAPATGDPGRELDAEAIDALTGAASADVALVATVDAGAPVPARGQPADVALVTAHARLVDHRKVIGQGTGSAAALGEDGLGYGADHAVQRAMADVLPPAPSKLAQAGSFQGDDSPVAEPGIVLVRLPSKTPWNLVLAEQHYLAGARGVRAASLRRVSPHGWVIGVQTSDAPEHVAQVARHAPTADTTAAVEIAGAIVEVNLTGSSS